MNMQENIDESFDSLKISTCRRSSFGSQVIRNRLVGGMIFVIVFLIFIKSPVQQVCDSMYSMLLSENLWKNRTFKLDSYFKLPLDPKKYPFISISTFFPDYPYQIEVVKDHVYYWSPPGSSILSIPFVVLLNSLGVSTVNPDMTFNDKAEIKIEVLLASLLMAGFTVLVFYMGLQVLPLNWSFLVALAGALGTQIWSTASRALWTHTWSMFILSIVILILLKNEICQKGLSPVLIGTLLSWMYFTRPTASITIFTVSIFIFFYFRKIFLWYSITGAFWLGVFLSYSFYNFEQVLPRYYLFHSKIFSWRIFWEGLIGNLFSPSRGLFVYAPICLFALYLSIRYFKYINHKRLVFISLASIILHIVAISGSLLWWGGGCYGARLCSDIVPWWCLLGILGVRGMLNWQQEYKLKAKKCSFKLHIFIGLFLLLLSIIINARGALDYRTALWNMVPTEIDKDQKRLWDWRYPQFLAGLVSPPVQDFLAPVHFPVYVPGNVIDFSSVQSQKFLWTGWSFSESNYRWSDSRKAGITFRLSNSYPSSLRIKCWPFLHLGKLQRQRLCILLNGHRIGNLDLDSPGDKIYLINIPKGLFREKNVMTFLLPDAKSPLNVGLNQDSRKLGIAVKWLLLE